MADLFGKLPAGAQGELYTRTLRSSAARWNDSEFEGTTDSVNRSAALRIIAGGRMSIATSTKPGDEQTLLDNALAAVKYGTAVNYDFPGKAPLSDISLVDERVSQVDLARMVEISEDLVQVLIRHDSRIKVNGGVERHVVEVSLANSNGFSGSYRKTVWSASLGGQLIQGDDFLWLGESSSSTGPDLDYDELKQFVIQQFEWSKNIVPFEAGTYPVLFAPEQVSFLMTPFLACLNGKAFTRGISPWREKLGERLLDPRVTLVDDGTLQRSETSAPFDREGVPTRRNILIDRGVASQLLLDLQTAKELGRQSTGNGTLTGPQPHRAFLLPGETAHQELIRGIDKGLLIFGSMGAWTGNPYSGNVSGTVSVGLKIEHGQIVGRVKNCMFSVNVFEAFRDRLIGLSSDTRGIGGGMGAPGATFPYVALNDVVIATK
ncbi:MAG: TldD/PmbA family protein [Chloroflexota bacterium]